MKTLSIIIPVYNEEKLIAHTIQRVISADSCGLKKEIIVVDDGSKDETASRINVFLRHSERSRGIPSKIDPSASVGMTSIKILFIQKKKNEGKGAALKTGFKKATGDILMVQDADEEYSVEDYPALLSPFLKNEAQIVYGSRNKKKKSYHNKYSYFIFYLGGLFLTVFINILYGLKLTDQPTGYKLFSSKIKSLLLKPQENRFSYEVAVTAILAKNKIPFIEVPIHYRPRTLAEGKKINGVDFIKSLIVAVKYRIMK